MSTNDYGTKLKQLIIEHPDYPIVHIMPHPYAIEYNALDAWQQDPDEDYPIFCCSTARFSTNKVIYCPAPCNGYKECYYVDMKELRFSMEDWLLDNVFTDDMPSEERNKLLEQEMSKLNPQWVDAIWIM